MKLSNLDILCSVPLKQAKSLNSSTNEEGTSPFQALFSELQLVAKESHLNSAEGAKSQSDLNEDNEDVVEAVSESEVKDGALLGTKLIISKGDVQPVKESNNLVSEKVSNEIGDIELPAKQVVHPEFFIELPRRPITVVDLPKIPVPLIPSVTIFESLKQFEGGATRKIETIFSGLTEDLETHSLPSQQLYIKPLTNDVNFTTSIQQQEVIDTSIPEGLVEVDTDLELINQKETPILEKIKPPLLPEITIKVHVPEDVQELEFLRKELPRTIFVPLKESLGTSGGAFRIQIFPEHLGHIDLMVSVEEGQVTAKMITSSHLAKDVLELQLPQLRQQLLEQGVAMEAFEIEWQEEKDAPHHQHREPQAETPRHQQSQTGSAEQGEQDLESQLDEGIDYSV